MDKAEEGARARAVVAALNVAIEAVKEAERQAGSTKLMPPKLVDQLNVAMGRHQAKLLERMAK